MAETYGDWLKRTREAVPMTQQALGDRVGVARTYVNKIERGRVDLPNLELRMKIAAALGEDYAPKPAVNEDAPAYDAVTATMLRRTEHWSPDMKAILWRVIDGIDEEMKKKK
jgi:transcriptional regulator with XRE-family HTH domain